MFARLRSLALIALLAALIAAAAGCVSGSIETEEGPVPDGMPVMYEFLTQS